MDSYFVPRAIAGWAGTDTVATSEHSSPFSSFAAWNTTENDRRVTVPVDCRFSRLTATISINNNSIAGATLNSRVDNVDGNQTLALGTGAGVFSDLTNNDFLSAEQRYDWEYTQADGTAVFKSVVNVCETLA